MEKTYTTKQGDAWDAIAFRVYEIYRLSHAGQLPAPGHLCF